MNFSKQRTKLFILIALAILVKLAILHGVINFRVWEENKMALNYLQTGQMAYYQDGALKYNFGDPIYPYLLVLIYKLFGVNYAFAAILNIIFSALSALLIYDVFDAFFDRFNLPEKVKEWKPQILLLSVAGLLFHPLIMYYEIKNVHPFASYVFFMSLGLWAMVKYFRKSTSLSLFLFSFTMSLVIFGRSTLVCILIPFFFWLLKRDKLKKSIIKLLYVGSIASVVSLLWMLYIQLKYHPKYISPNDGIVMWMGSLPQTEGSNNFPNGLLFYAALSDSDLKVLSKIPTASQDSFYRAKYMYTLEHNPGQIAKMFFIKFKNFWLFRKAIGVDYPPNVQALLPLYKIAYLTVLFLALLAAIKIGREAFVLLSLPFGVSLIHAAVYVETRHRIMFEPLLIFLAIICVALLIGKRVRT